MISDKNDLVQTFIFKGEYVVESFTYLNQMSPVARKHVFGEPDQVRHIPSCSAAETSNSKSTHFG